VPEPNEKPKPSMGFSHPGRPGVHHQRVDHEHSLRHPVFLAPRPRGLRVPRMPMGNESPLPPLPQPQPCFRDQQVVGHVPHHTTAQIEAVVAKGRSETVTIELDASGCG